MALPVTISGAVFPEQNYYCGPFKSSAGHFYTIMRESSSILNIGAFRATDPTDSFAESDSGNRPSLSARVRAIWVYPVSDVLHIAHQEQGSGRVGYSTFDMAGNSNLGLWGTVDLLVEEPGAANFGASSSVSCSIAVDSESGDVMVLYNGAQDKVMGQDRDRVDFAVKVNGSFTQVGTTVDGSPIGDGDEEDWFGSVIVRGSVSGGRSRFHFFFKNDTLSDAFQRTAVWGGSTYDLETFPTAGDTTVATLNHAFGPGISYDDGGTQRVRCPYLDGVTFDIAYAEFDSVDAPGAFTVNAAISDFDVVDINGSPVLCMAVDGTDEHLLYAQITTNDLFHDKNDGTDVEVLDDVTVNRISCNVYDRSGTKLAYVYDDGGTIKYNEVDIGVAAPAIPPFLFEKRIKVRLPIITRR